MNSTLLKLAESWTIKNSSVSKLDDILEFIKERNETTEVEIKKINLADCDPWFYDEVDGSIHNEDKSFFSIVGCKQDTKEQPIILQKEIGYLGIICREIDGVIHFLMQAKIEPGNVNCVQISPTIQATKSNFSRKHGGKEPPYLEYFVNADKYEIIVDQIQSEQSSRFYQKRNRNMILLFHEDVPILPNFMWMTLGQIKELMKEDNLVNMDTRTVLSCIPFSKLRATENELRKLEKKFTNKALFRSLFYGDEKNQFPSIYYYINNQKMYYKKTTELVPLKELEHWQFKENEFVCLKPYPFKVIFCDIDIEGREVKHWRQPLMEANGIATFGLLCCVKDGILKFVVKATKEMGCFDKIELGPTIQDETILEKKTDMIRKFFYEQLENKDQVLFDHLLSEEGGRFYHEQNRNILLMVAYEKLPPLPGNYFLVDFRTLNEMVQINNTLNIQLRNLLSLWEA